MIKTKLGNDITTIEYPNCVLECPLVSTTNGNSFPTLKGKQGCYHYCFNKFVKRLPEESSADWLNRYKDLCIKTGRMISKKVYEDKFKRGS